MSNETMVTIRNGHLGADPENKTTKNGTPYLRLRIGTTPYRRNKDTHQIENGETEWWTVDEYDTRQAETYRQQLHKGDSVRVDGQLRLRIWTDQHGQPQIDRSIGFANVSKNMPKAKANGGFNGSQPAAPPQTGAYNPTTGDAWASGSDDFSNEGEW